MLEFDRIEHHRIATQQAQQAFGSNDVPLTMTSLEIESLTGSRHDSVKRTIERFADSGVISLPSLREVKVQRERNGRKQAQHQSTPCPWSGTGCPASWLTAGG